jgi:hypothetical protein
VHSFPLEEVEATNHNNPEYDDDNAVRLILEGGARGPTAQGHRLDLSFCPAIDLPAGDPSRPRPPAVRAAPVELRFFDCRAEEYVDDEAGGGRGGDRRRLTAFFLRFLAAVGGGAQGGWRA